MQNKSDLSCEDEQLDANLAQIDPHFGHQFIGSNMLGLNKIDIDKVYSNDQFSGSRINRTMEIGNIIKSDRSLKMSHISVGKSNSTNSNNQDCKEILTEWPKIDKGFQLGSPVIEDYFQEQHSVNLEYTSRQIETKSGSSLNPKKRNSSFQKASTSNQISDLPCTSRMDRLGQHMPDESNSWFIIYMFERLIII